MEKFGSSHNFFGGSYESSLKGLVKSSIGRISRNIHYTEELVMWYYENQVCKLALQFREHEGQKKNNRSHYQERKALGSKTKCGWKCTNDSNVCVSESDIVCMFIDNKWIISITQQKSECVHCPLKDDDEGNNWVTLLCQKAQECNFDMVTFGFKCDSHNTFQCHPKFLSHP